MTELMANKFAEVEETALFVDNDSDMCKAHSKRGVLVLKYPIEHSITAERA